MSRDDPVPDVLVTAMQYMMMPGDDFVAVLFSAEEEKGQDDD